MSNNNLQLDEILRQGIVSAEEIIDVNEALLQIVIFSLAEEWYAFYGDNISEILPQSTPVFFVPGCPSSLIGVINLRGEIESVIDIAQILKLDKHRDSETILLGQTMGGQCMRSGICVNQVIDVINILESEIHAAPDNLPESIGPYVLGVIQFNEHAVTLLNLEQIFNEFS